MTYCNGNPYAGPAPDAPLDKWAHDECLPGDQFTVTMLDDFTTGRTDPATGYRVYDTIPHRHQNWPWHWFPIWGAPKPCAYCNLPVRLPLSRPSDWSEHPPPESEITMCETGHADGCGNPDTFLVKTNRTANPGQTVVRLYACQSHLTKAVTDQMSNNLRLAQQGRPGRDGVTVLAIAPDDAPDS